MSYRHVPLCVHHQLQHFTGRAQFDAGNGIVIAMHGELEGLDQTQPAQLDVQLPQRREMPWWLHAYCRLCPGLADAQLDAEQPRVTVDIEPAPVSCFLPWIDCSAWTVTLPGVPVAIAIETLCGYLPLHFVVRQGATEYARFVLQQHRRCTHVRH